MAYLRGGEKIISVEVKIHLFLKKSIYSLNSPFYMKKVNICMACLNKRQLFIFLFKKLNEMEHHYKY